MYVRSYTEFSQFLSVLLIYLIQSSDNIFRKCYQPNFDDIDHAGTIGEKSYTNTRRLSVCGNHRFSASQSHSRFSKTDSALSSEWTG